MGEQVVRLKIENSKRAYEYVLPQTSRVEGVRVRGYGR